MAFTQNKSFKLEKGLLLEERKGAKNYKARMLIGGKYRFFNTETDDYAIAERRAKSEWRKRHRAKEGTPEGHSMLAVAEGFLSSVEKESTRKNHRVKWNRIKGFFDTFEVEDVTSKTLNDFIKWRRTDGKTRVVNHTIRKDLVTIRRILKWAAYERLIDAVPSIPPAGKVEANPRPWFEEEEWKTLKAAAKQRIADPNINPRTKAQREELYDFMMMMVHSCTRVDELRNVRVRDCSIKHLSPKEQEQRKINSAYYLRIHINGKTGTRRATTWSGAVTAFQRLVARGSLKPNDLLFKEHHRDGFRELLEATGLRRDRDGKLRNLKALRSTALMLRIIQNPHLNLKVLAVNAGTSVTMLDKFYLKALTADTFTDQLV
jgi:hypothetical protein